jgi:dTMP kinase
MSTAHQRGRFITFEGIDGAGKSTQIAAAKTLIERHGAQVLLTREPGGTALGERLRELLLHHEMSQEVELALMFAARTQHLQERIGPALAAGTWVLCDRFTDSTYAYQGGGRQIPLATIQALESWMQSAITLSYGRAIQPERTYLFDLDTELAQLRRSQARPADRIEAQEQAFFERTRQAFLARAALEPTRFCVLNADLSKEVIAKQLEQDLLTHCFNG